MDIAKDSEFFLKFLEFKMHEGRRIKFWTDKWLGDDTLKDTFPDTYSISRSKKQVLLIVGKKM